MEYINIEPSDLVQIISKVKINVVYIDLNVRCGVQTICYDESNRVLQTYMCELVGEEYQNWQQDSYLENFILEKYGFIRKQVELI